MSKLRLICIGPSLGGAESFITHPASISYYKCSAQERRKLGIKNGLIRLAVGIEDTQDIIDDIDQALAAVSRSRPRARSQARSVRTQPRRSSDYQ